MLSLMQEDSAQPALVGVTSLVIKEYDAAKPNDYEEYKRERKKRAMEAEVWKELDRQWQKEKEKEQTEGKKKKVSKVAAGGSLSVCV